MRRVVTDQQRAKLLECFRTDAEAGSPASFRRAAEAAGVDWRTARRAFKVGWPGVPAICGLIESERHGARAALRREELAAMLDERSRLAQEDAIASRAEEGAAVRLVTRAASGVLAALHAEQMFAHARQLAVIEKENQPGSAKARAARSALKDIALTLARLAQAAERGQRMGRLLLGEATQILGGEVALRAVPAAETTPEAARSDLEALRRAIEYASDEQAAEPKLLGTGNGTNGAADGSAKPN